MPWSQSYPGRRSVRRRRPRRGRRTGRGRQQEALLVHAVVAIAAVTALVTAVNWLLARWWLLAVLGALTAAAGGGRLVLRQRRKQWERVRERQLRYALTQLDSLGHRDFEYAVRDLMRRDGCRDARQVGGKDDRGADVKATDPFGRRWVIQCKHRRQGARGTAVGTPDLHVLNGTARQLHGADVVVLVTNGRFSSGCPPLAASQRLHLVDRGLLGRWAGGARPLWELLRALPPP